MKRHRDVELVASDHVHHGPVFDVRRETVRLPSGLVQTIDAIDHPGAVAIAARDARGRLLVVRQYRHAVGDWLLEIPAGRLEADEDPRTAAARELEEETGHGAREWRLVRSFFPAPGFCSERLWLYGVTELLRASRRGPALRPRRGALHRVGRPSLALRRAHRRRRQDAARRRVGDA